MRRPRMLAAFALLTSLVANTVAAEELGTGARVRVILKGIGTKPIVGSLVASDAEALTLRTGKGEPRRVLVADVRRLEVSRRPGRRGRGALIGLAVGAVGGFIWGSSSNSDGCQPSPGNPCWFGTEPLFSDSESGAMGAVLFSGVGALVGAIVAPGEKWEHLSDPRVRVSVAPARRGAAVALSLRF